MCGINGILSGTVSPVPDLAHRLSVMNDLLRHRGPDGEGIWEHDNGHVGLGHVRLSIIDVANGRQPMEDARSNCVTFNGEIYNYLELAGEIGDDQFRTRSDTEVILQAYGRWGTACLERFRGMFAFALWDEDQQLCFAPATVSASSRSTTPRWATTFTLPPSRRPCCLPGKR